MKRFDRIIATLLKLHSRRVVKAAELAEEFGVSLRTVYRDIRSLETAGVPITGEAGVGYALIRGYHLPPVAFTAEEAAALLVGDRFMQAHAQGRTSQAYGQALAKVRAVLKGHDKDLVENLEHSVAVFANGPYRHEPTPDPWLAECQGALGRRRVLEVTYRRRDGARARRRRLEPIGLYHARSNWHLVAWCRLREDYRDFRLDRMETLTVLEETYSPHEHRTLDAHMAAREDAASLIAVDLGFPEAVAEWVSEDRYRWGFVSETRNGQEVRMRFLVPALDALAQWLLPFGGRVAVHGPEALRRILAGRAGELLAAYAAPSVASPRGARDGRREA